MWWLYNLRKSRQFGASALGTALVLATYTEWRDGTGAQPGRPALALDLMLCDRQVRAHIAALTRGGWLTVTPGRGLGRGRGRAPDSYSLAIPEAVTRGSQLPGASVTRGSQEAVTRGSQAQSHSALIYKEKRSSPPAPPAADTGRRELALRGENDLDSRGIHARLAAACPELGSDEIEAVLAELRANPKINSPTAVIMARISDGTIRDYVGDLVVKHRRAARQAAALLAAEERDQAEREKRRKAEEASRERMRAWSEKPKREKCSEWMCMEPVAWWDPHDDKTACHGHGHKLRNWPPVRIEGGRVADGETAAEGDNAASEPANAEMPQLAVTIGSTDGDHAAMPRVPRLAQCPWCGATAKAGSVHKNHRDGSRCHGLAA